MSVGGPHKHAADAAQEVTADGGLTSGPGACEGGNSAGAVPNCGEGSGKRCWKSPCTHVASKTKELLEKMTPATGGVSLRVSAT